MKHSIISLSLRKVETERKRSDSKVLWRMLSCFMFANVFLVLSSGLQFLC